MMNGVLSLQDLLTQLYHYKDELKFIFSRQQINEPVNYFDYINDTDKERMLFVLQEWGILFMDDNLIRLDTQTYDFFAQKLNVNKIINVADVQDLITNIRDYIQYSKQDERRKLKYVLQIREIFYSIERKTRISMDNLRNNIDETYKQTTDLNVKKKELEKLDEKRMAIQAVISQTIDLLKNEHDFFYKNGMENRTVQLIRLLNNYSWEVSELHNLIINYLFRVEIQTGKIRKIKKLKFLLDRQVLEVSSDVETVLAAEQGLPLVGVERKETKIPLDWLQNTDDALDIIDRVRSDIQFTVRKKNSIAGAIEDEYLNREPIYVDVLDYESIKDGFLAQRQELMKYICNYPFGIELCPDDLVDIYMQLCSVYMDEFYITDDYGIFNQMKYKIIKPLNV